MCGVGKEYNDLNWTYDMQMKRKNEKENPKKNKKKNSQTHANDTNDSIPPKLELCTVLSAQNHRLKS